MYFTSNSLNLLSEMEQDIHDKAFSRYPAVDMSLLCGANPLQVVANAMVTGFGRGGWVRARWKRPLTGRALDHL